MQHSSIRDGDIVYDLDGTVITVINTRKLRYNRGGVVESLCYETEPEALEEYNKLIADRIKPV